MIIVSIINPTSSYFAINYENKRSFNFPENLIFLNLSKYFLRNLTQQER